MNRDDIKACPFCGKPATVEIRTVKDKEYYAIGCANIACRGSAWAGDPDAVRALSRWNERAGDREPAASKTAEAKHVGIGDLLGHIEDELNDALTLVATSPTKTKMWMAAAINMAEHCQGSENCDQAAMRVLAAEVRRLRNIIGETLSENSHLADGDNCTLLKLKLAMWPKRSMWPNAPHELPPTKEREPRSGSEGAIGG